MGNIIPFLGCLIFIFPFLATSHIVLERLPEEINDYNKMEKRSGPWQDSNMFRASKLWNFRPRKRNTIEPDEDVGEDSYIIMEGVPEDNNDLSNLEKRGSARQNSNFFRASKRMGFRATKRSSAEPDAKELQAWKRMNFRATKRVGGELVPTQEEEEEEEGKDIGIQRRGENLSRVQRQLNSHFFRQQRA